jgi:beta-N-acetylhexosaminidase
MRSRPVLVLAVVATLSVALAAWAVASVGGGTATNETARAATTTTDPIETPARTTTAETFPCSPIELVSEWDLRLRLAQMLMIGVSNEAEAAALLGQFDVGGVFVHGNDTAILQGGVLQRLRAGRTVPPIIAVDEEGGRVQRIDGLYGPVPSARELAGTRSVDQVRDLAEERGRQLAESGVTMNLAPVVDISSQANGSVIGDRSFSPDPATATAYAEAFAEGLRASGIVPVFKHFPGHGRSAGDSHEGPTTTPSLESLRISDLAPYRALLDDAEAVMVGHLDVPGLTEPATPTSLSRATISGLLRDELGFDGLVLTDDLIKMRAVTDRFDLPAAVLGAFNAGADMALWVTTERVAEVIDHLERSVGDGSLTESRVNEAVVRILRVKDIDPCL